MPRPGRHRRRRRPGRPDQPDGRARPAARARCERWAALAACSTSPLRLPRSLLVAATDGVGTKVLLAAEAGASMGRHRPRRHVRQRPRRPGRPAAVLPRLFRHRRLEPGAAAEVVAGISDGCRARRLRPDRRRDRRDAGPLSPRRVRSRRLRRRRRRADAVLPRSDLIAGGDVVLGLASSGVHANGFSLVRLVLREQGLGVDDACPWEPGRRLGRGAAGADPDLCPQLPRRDRRRAASRRSRTSPAAA